MKKGVIFIISKPTFQVPNKSVECLFDFRITYIGII